MFESPIVRIMQDIEKKILNPYEDNIGIKIGSQKLNVNKKTSKKCCN